MYFEKLDDTDESKVHCLLCPQDCVIKPGTDGACKARRNIGGELYSLNYGRVTSISLDPVEKKPLSRFHPGSYILSAGSFGCNLKCAFCQNWSISQMEARTNDASPEMLVKKAAELKSRGNIGIAYTYNEPFIWYEFVYETAAAAKKAGLLNVLVTNGFVREDPLRNLLPSIDAMNIDLKSFSDDFYKKICKGSLEHVKKTIMIAAAAEWCHVELTTLIIPGLNDSEAEIGETASWISSISPDIPLHLSRFFPDYEMRDRPPTPRETLEKAAEIASKHLKYVYIGNI